MKTAFFSDKDYPLTISKALAKGVIFLALIPVVWYIAPFLLIPLLYKLVNLYLAEVFILGLFLVPLFWVLGWLWWSFFVVKWKLWAYHGIPEDQLDLLKQKAIMQKLIWRDGHFFNNTEIWMEEDRIMQTYIQNQKNIAIVWK